MASSTLLVLTHHRPCHLKSNIRAGKVHLHHKVRPHKTSSWWVLLFCSLQQIVVLQLLISMHPKQAVAGGNPTGTP